MYSNDFPSPKSVSENFGNFIFNIKLFQVLCAGDKVLKLLYTGFMHLLDPFTRQYMMIKA